MHLETFSNLILLRHPKSCPMELRAEQGSDQLECCQPGMENSGLHELQSSHTQCDITVHKGLEIKKNWPFMWTTGLGGNTVDTFIFLFYIFQIFL